MKLATVLILLMAMLNLVPPMFSETVYFDNVFYSILYLLLSFIGISIPFLVPKLNIVLRVISNLLGGWYISALFYEVINFANPDSVLNTQSDKTLFVKFVMCFISALVFLMINKTWKANT